jgi:hypothetical protein
MTYATLRALDLTAEAIELIYDLGSFTRTRVVPALVAIYVALEVLYTSVRTRRLSKEVYEWFTWTPEETPQEPKVEAVKKPTPKKKRAPKTQKTAIGFA